MGQAQGRFKLIRENWKQVSQWGRSGEGNGEKRGLLQGRTAGIKSDLVYGWRKTGQATEWIQGAGLSYETVDSTTFISRLQLLLRFYMHRNKEKQTPKWSFCSQTSLNPNRLLCCSHVLLRFSIFLSWEVVFPTSCVHVCHVGMQEQHERRWVAAGDVKSLFIVFFFNTDFILRQTDWYHHALYLLWDMTVLLWMMFLFYFFDLFPSLFVWHCSGCSCNYKAKAITFTP